MQDRPTASELLATIAELLEDQVLTAVEGPLKHQVRVAANLCRILEREADLGPEHDRREVELLASVLQEDVSGRSASELSQALADRIRTSSDAALERRAFPALLEIVRGKLAIAKPGHDAYDFSEELDA